MASNPKWIDDDNISFRSIDQNTYNNKVIINPDGLEDLVRYLEVGEFPDALFITATDWISSITYYPFKIWEPNMDYTMKIGIFSTSVHCGIFTNSGQYFYNMGTINIEPKFYNFADYNGYTKIQCWLPYYGMIELLPNDVMGKKVQFWLAVDYNTGSAMYYICVYDTRDTTPENARIVLTVNFQIGFTLPLGSANAINNMRNIAIGAVKGIGQLAITAIAINAGGTGAASVVTSSASTQAKSTHRNPTTGRQVTQSTYSIDKSETFTRQYDNTKYLKYQLANNVFNNSISALEQMHITAQTDKPNNINLTRNGSRSIKVVIYRPLMKDITSEYTHLMGKPLGRVLTLGDLTGYTEISYVHTEGEDFATATAEEMEILNNELLGGILL